MSASEEMTERQRELFVKLGEEATEVAHAVMKILIHGRFAADPRTSIMNINKLTEEISDLLSILNILQDTGEIGYQDMGYRNPGKTLGYLYHQQGDIK